MKNKMLMLGGALIIVALVTGVYITNKEEKSTVDNNTVQVRENLMSPESRCDKILTLDEANKITGLNYLKREVDGQVSGKIIVTTCTFSAPGLSRSIKPFSVLMRYATTTQEAKAVFEESKSASYADGQALEGIGDEALWSPSFGQVSVLKGQTWIIVAAMKNKENALSISRIILDKIK